MNCVMLTGRLTKDVELIVKDENRCHTSFDIAVDRRFPDKEGNKKCDFIKCMAFGSRAKFLSNYCKQGDLVLLSGTLETSTYEKDGVKVKSYCVVIDGIEPLSKKKSPSVSGEDSEDADEATSDAAPAEGDINTDTGSDDDGTLFQV